MSELQVYSWNVSDGLGDPARAALIAEKMAEDNPDIAIFCEGVREGHSIDPAAARILTDVGALHSKPYADTDGRRDRHDLVAVARKDFGKPEIVNILGRNVMIFPDAEGFTVAGFHGFDRYGLWPDDPEEARKRQVRTIVGQRALNQGGPAILLADLNAMHKSDPIAKNLRRIRPLVGLLPSQDPGIPQNKLERLGSLAKRLCSMAEGGVLQELYQQGFYDADRFYQPTMQKGPVSVQLDHVMLRAAEARAFAVHSHDGLSDHSPISATVVAKK